MTEFISALTANPPLFISLTFILGLIVGSFLNVVIHRLPIMMRRDWEAQCAEFSDNESPKPAERYNLLFPASRCGACGHRITAAENVPILSFLWLRGKCSACGARISLRYPVVELLAGLLSAVVAWRLGPGWPAVFALLFTWALIALAGIDLDEKLLPDAITLPLLWLGLLISLWAGRADTPFADPRSAIIGAVAGYLSLWLLYHVFKLATGKEGMGYGDFKLLAALGAWGGWQLLPLTVILSTVVGAITGIALILFLGRDRQIPIPFGPYLAAAGWISLLWGPDIMAAYFSMSGLR